MPKLPTGREVREIQKRINAGNGDDSGGGYAIAQVMDSAIPLAKKAMAPASAIVQSGVSHAASIAGHVPTALHVGAVGGTSVVSVGGVGAAVGPALTAGAIALTADKYIALCDLKACAEGDYENVDVPYLYSCDCGQCAKNLDYIIAKEQGWMGCKALGAATFGFTALGKVVFELAKGPVIRAQGRERQSHQVSKSIVASAKARCEVAIATVFLFSDKWTPIDRSEHSIARTVEVILAEKWGKVLNAWASLSK